jgi:streptogrisin C
MEGSVMARARHFVIPLIIALALPPPSAVGTDGTATDTPLVTTEITSDLPDVTQPQIDDPISEAELEDLKTLASQQGMSLQAAIDRYAWNDNFALAVSTIREASPEAFTGAEIVDGGRAWIAFAAGAPNRALEIIDTFTKSHATVTIEVRPDVGVTEVELEMAVATVHSSVFEAANVRDATTSFDFDTRQITTVVVLDGGVADSALDDLRAGATDSLIDSGLGGLLDSIAVTVVRSSLPALGGN